MDSCNVWSRSDRGSIAPRGIASGSFDLECVLGQRFDSVATTLVRGTISVWSPGKTGGEGNEASTVARGASQVSLCQAFEHHPLKVDRQNHPIE
jgi:hypothetical protein